MTTPPQPERPVNTLVDPVLPPLHAIYKPVDDVERQRAEEDPSAIPVPEAQWKAIRQHVLPYVNMTPDKLREITDLSPEYASALFLGLQQRGDISLTADRYGEFTVLREPGNEARRNTVVWRVARKLGRVGVSPELARPSDSEAETDEPRKWGVVIVKSPLDRINYSAQEPNSEMSRPIPPRNGRQQVPDPHQRRQQAAQQGQAADPHRTASPRPPQSPGVKTPTQSPRSTGSSGRQASTPRSKGNNPTTTTSPDRTAQPARHGSSGDGKRFVIDPTKTSGSRSGTGERPGTQPVSGPARQGSKPPHQESGRSSEKPGRRAEDTWEMTLMLLAGKLSGGKQPPSTSPLSLARTYVRYFRLDGEDLNKGVPAYEAEQNAIKRVLGIAGSYFTRLQKLGYVSSEYVKIDPNNPSHDKRKTGYIVTAKKDDLEKDIREHRRLRAERERQEREQ